jgi:hypothetical protein
MKKAKFFYLLRRGFFAGGGGEWSTLVSAFKTRVIADGGTLESESCIRDDVKYLIQNPEPVPTPAFDADYQAVLDRATTQGYTAPSAAQQTLQNTLVEDLKTAGVWSKLDALYITANDGSSDFGRLNWASPSAFELSEVSSPTFTSNEGFTGNGSSSTLDTGINMGVDTTQFNQSTLNGSFGGWSYNTKITGGPALMGDESDINQLRGGSADSIFGYRAGWGVLISGLYHMNGDGTNSIQYANGVQIASIALGTLETSTNTMHFLSEGGLASFSADTISIAFIGGDLSAEASDLYNAFNTYMSAL